MVTLKVLAERAGVSVSAVSAVINGSRHVRMADETRSRILSVIEESGYVPNHAARSLALSRSKILAVVIPKVSNPIFVDMTDGIYDAADELGYAVLLGDAARVTSGSNLLKRIVGEGLVDGTLVRSSATVNRELVHKLSKRAAPVVLLDESQEPDATWIAVDEQAATRLATEHLLELGHSDVGFLGGRRGFIGTVRRRAGFHAALTSAGITCPDQWVVDSGYTPEDGYAVANELLKSGVPHPTALVVNNVTTARGVIAAVLDVGLKVPEDISIVGIHDTPEAASVRPAITAVKMPMYQLGYEGVRALIRLLDGGTVESRILDEPGPELIVRGSTAHA